jgi:Tol biopolymer transport system component
MKKIRAFIIFALIPLIAGYLIASSQGQHKIQANSTLNFTIENILPTDRITLVEKGKIISLTNTAVNSIPTNDSALIEVSPLGNNFIGVDKQTNYSTLDEFSSDGALVKTLQNGNTGDIDTMNWFSDPTVNKNQKEIAFVSDKDKATTNIQDNVLFVENLSSGNVEDIADPDPHSGGIAHPVWDPTNPTDIIYDYYQYDSNYNPYSIIDEYNVQSQTTSQLTTQQQNAYQGSFSPDGKHLIFLERNNDITTVMYMADITGNGLSNVHSIASGDFAYPEFSYTQDHIYYLEATGNTGYDLMTAEIIDDKLTNPTALSTGEQLLANSGFIIDSIK